MDITTATPVQIDTEVAHLAGQAAKAAREITTIREVLDRCAVDSYARACHNVPVLEQKLQGATTRFYALQGELTRYQVEFDRRGGWTRYYLVDAHNGHVHYDASGYRCSRTQNTVHVWLTEQSGTPAAELIELAGDRACTICFPDAPVEVLARPSHFTPPTVAEKQARASERDRRAMARRAKEITNSDGTPLLVKEYGYYETIKTVRAAEIRVVDLAFNSLAYGRALQADELTAVRLILTALAAKRQTGVGTERAAMEVRLVNKCKREQVTYREVRGLFCGCGAPSIPGLDCLNKLCDQG